MGSNSSERDHLSQHCFQIIPISAPWAGGWKTGSAEGLPAGTARRLAGRLGQVQLVVAYEASPLAAEASLAKRRFGGPDQRMPVEPNDPLALAAPDQHLETLHRDVEIERLNPIDGDAQRIVVAQVVELGAIFALDSLDAQGLAPTIGLCPVSLRTRQRR